MMTTEPQFEYPDGSTPPLDEDGQPILEDRTAEFPEEAAEAVEVVAEPVRTRRLGPTSGISAFRGLAAKRRERAQRSLQGAQDAPEEPSTDEETTLVENDAEQAPEPVDEGYDPTAHTVAEVEAYLSENEDQAEYVLDRERAGKARVSLIGA